MKGVLYPDRFLRSGLAPAHGPLRVKDSLDARPEAAHVADEDHPPRDLSVEAGAMRRECVVDRSGGSPHAAQRARSSAANQALVMGHPPAARKRGSSPPAPGLHARRALMEDRGQNKETLPETTHPHRAQTDPILSALDGEQNNTQEASSDETLCRSDRAAVPCRDIRWR